MRISDWSSDVCSSDLQSNSCLDRLNHGFCCNAEFLEEFLGRGGGAEAAHADEGAAGLDPAVPAEAGRRLDGDVQRAGPEHLVALVRRLLLYVLPGRPRHARGGEDRKSVV